MLLSCMLSNMVTSMHLWMSKSYKNSMEWGKANYPVKTRFGLRIQQEKATVLSVLCYEFAFKKALIDNVCIVCLCRN